MSLITNDITLQDIVMESDDLSDNDDVKRGICRFEELDLLYANWVSNEWTNEIMDVSIGNNDQADRQIGCCRGQIGSSQVQVTDVQDDISQHLVTSSMGLEIE